MRHVIGWLLLTPAAILLIAFTYWPIGATVADSLFSRGNPIRPSRFIGLENYALMADDPIFWQVLWNNALFALGTIPASIALALMMALMVNRALPGRALARMAFFTPTILPMIAVANIWLFFYTPDIGLIDQIAGLIGLPGHNWLGDPDTVLGAIIVMTVWKEAGFFMIFYLAALQTIPPELWEAARLEGAARWTYFRRILFPLLMPTTLFVLINAILNSFKLVDHLFILTKGGPDNASNLLLYYIFETAFSFFDTTYAATLTVVLLLVLAVLSLVQYVVLDKRIHYR
ncbi:carbohydrate ABC transporter permease [Rhodospira trueperi]|uniref:sn-glycerol 3-phosphate transport system permease protein n=1 Tax=Rhodospira trueperi TaxID=69960 RepID=A0A1G7AN19_9PROT|nr:sugar ABC transporter permease [Rhodospira trueperi]SDE16268.1 sn-glycerol 3-phosphate transport system permease protein [Rhodospira trueperi]